MVPYPHLYADQQYAFRAEQQIYTVARAKFRLGAGLDRSVIRLLSTGAVVQVLNTEPTAADGLWWWRVRNDATSGYIAEAAQNGVPILASISITQQQQVIYQEAERLDLSPEIALAVFAVESAPHDLPGPHLPLNLEPHILIDYLILTAPAQRNTFFNHFAYGSPPWTDQGWSYGPDSNWMPLGLDQHNQRLAIDLACRLFGREAALRATSMGPGQIMGFNHKEMGYTDARTMFDTWRAEPLAAVRSFFRYLETSGLLTPLRQRDWEAFAMGYNGVGNHQSYAAKLARSVDYMETATAHGSARRICG